MGYSIETVSEVQWAIYSAAEGARLSKFLEITFLPEKKNTIY